MLRSNFDFLVLTKLEFRGVTGVGTVWPWIKSFQSFRSICKGGHLQVHGLEICRLPVRCGATPQLVTSRDISENP